MVFKRRNGGHGSHCTLVYRLYGGAVQAVLLVLISMGGALTAAAQANTATVNGIVTDSSGAVIPGATIQLSNTASGSTTKTRSNRTGLFSFSGVESGDYRITVSRDGFKTLVQAGLHLDPGDTRRISDLVLQPGEVSEAVTVTATNGGVETDSGEVSSTISAADIADLSVEGRDVTELLKILPGMAISGGGTYKTNGGDTQNVALDPTNVTASGGMGGYVSNGTLKNGTALLVDGADITDAGAYGIAIQNVNYDQVAEVKVQAGSFTADTARGPVVINTISKSGGSTYHGSAYVYGRAYPFNAFDALAKEYKTTPPKDRQIYPGFSFGGPVRLPFTDWNKNNKLTFFVGGEAYEQRNVYASNTSSSIVRALVPTAGMRLGQFNQAELQQYLGDQYKTTTSGSTTTCTGSYASLCPVPSVSPTGGAITNGDISAYLDPLSKALFNIMPLPNETSVGGYNYQTTAFTNNNLWQGRVRVDYALSDRTKIFASYGIEKGVNVSFPSQTTTLGGGFTGAFEDGGQLNTLQSHVASFNVNSVLSNSLTNEFYVAGAYLQQLYFIRDTGPLNTNPYSQMIFATGSHSLPTLSDGNLPGYQVQDTSYPQHFANKQIHSVGDDLTKLFGRHVFRTGVFYQYDSNPQFNTGTYTNGYFSTSDGNASFTDEGAKIYNVGSGSNAFTGVNYVANFAEGHLSSFTQANKQVEANLYFWTLAGYLQDHWRATNRLSVDYGVRFEHLTPWQDAHGIGTAVFRPDLYQSDAAAYLNGGEVYLPGVRWHAIDPSIPVSGVPTKSVFVSPRIGFAWSPYKNNQTVLRGGAGMYRQHDSYNDLSNPTNTAYGSYNYSQSGSGGVQFSTLSQYEATGAVAKSNFTRDSSGIYTVDPTDDRLPTVVTYNLMVDQFLPHSMYFEVAYVGNDSYHLLNNQYGLHNINALPVGSLYGPFPSTRPDVTGIAPGTLLGFFPSGTSTSCGTTSTTSSCGVYNLSQAMVDAYRPYSLYNSLYRQRHVMIANYNSLQTQFAIRGKRASFNTNYTWGKALGNYWGDDPTNYKNDYGPLLSDRRNLFNATYSYHLGRFTRRAWAAPALNDWMISGIVSFQTGFYLPTPYNYNYNLTGTLSLPKGETATVDGRTSTCGVTTCSVSASSSQALLGTPEVKAMPVYVGDAHGKKKYQFVDPTVLRLPNIMANGPLKAPDLRGPSYFNSDITLQKSIPLGEKKDLALRAAAFNFLNHPLLTFSSANSNNYTLNYAYTPPAAGSLNGLLPTLSNQQSIFGSTVLSDGVTPQKTGRRIMEFSVKYTF